MLLQGKGIEEFVQFELEPKILWARRSSDTRKCIRRKCSSRISGSTKAARAISFGPLVIAGVYVIAVIARKFLEAESRTASESVPMREFGRWRKSSGKRRARSTIVVIGPERYNDLYEKFGNLNSLLGWGHARVIENLLAKRPDCPRALSDKFADARVIERSVAATRPAGFSSSNGRKRNRIWRWRRLDPGPRSIHRLAASGAGNARVKLGRGVSAAVKEGRESIGGKRRAGGTAEGGQDSLSHRARDRAEICGSRRRGAIAGGE